MVNTNLILHIVSPGNNRQGWQKRIKRISRPPIYHWQMHRQNPCTNIGRVAEQTLTLEVVGGLIRWSGCAFQTCTPQLHGCPGALGIIIKHYKIS